MAETDGDQAPYPMQACAAVAVLAGLAVLALGLGALNDLREHAQELQVVCGEGDCRADRRSYAEQHAVLLLALGAAIAVLVASVFAMRRLQPRAFDQR